MQPASMKGKPSRFSGGATPPLTPNNQSQNFYWLSNFFWWLFDTQGKQYQCSPNEIFSQRTRSLPASSKQ